MSTTTTTLGEPKSATMDHFMNMTKEAGHTQEIQRLIDLHAVYNDGQLISAPINLEGPGKRILDPGTADGQSIFPPPASETEPDVARKAPGSAACAARSQPNTITSAATSKPSSSRRSWTASHTSSKNHGPLSSGAPSTSSTSAAASRAQARSVPSK